MKIQMIDKSFRNTVGYEHTTIESICTLLGKGIIEPSNIRKVEEILTLGFTFISGQYELKVV